jgi:uncharacterized protein (DUF924 family)
MTLAQTSDSRSARIVSFWREAGAERWFTKNQDFDQIIRASFLAVHEMAARGELRAWEADVQGALALVIILDQFPRNMFRGSIRAFATDPSARAVADRAIARGFDKKTEKILQQFFYLPFMHSESLADQDRSLQLYQALGDAEQLRFAIMHRDVVVRFGRFPHRNHVMNRVTIPAEHEFLKSGGFAG